MDTTDTTRTGGHQHQDETPAPRQLQPTPGHQHESCSYMCYSFVL